MTTTSEGAEGPLRGLRIVEFAGIGPGPFACMLLADMGADVVSLVRPGDLPVDPSRIVHRGRPRVTANLKNVPERDKVLALLEHADVLVEGFRPGVMERLGLGPDQVLARNPRLVYGRMTGWGQYGPLAATAGHDIDYIAIAGALHAIGNRQGPPVPPLNLVGDYGGGSLYLVAGILAGVLESRSSGRGQVVDAAICDGAASMMASHLGWAMRGEFREERGTNLLDGGNPCYCCYLTADGEYMALGALEARYFREFCRHAGVPETYVEAGQDPRRWPELRDVLERTFRSRTQAEWTSRFEGTDSCVAPVLPLSRATQHPHNIARNVFIEIDGITQPAPAPRFSRTPSRIRGQVAMEPATIDTAIDRWRRP